MCAASALANGSDYYYTTTTKCNDGLILNVLSRKSHNLKSNGHAFQHMGADEGMNWR